MIRLLKHHGRPALNRVFAHYSKVGDPEVFDPGTFSWEAELASHWKEIRAEAEQVLTLRDEVPSFHEVSPDQYRISQGDFWKTFWLRGFGERSETCSALCPVTDRVLEDVPGLENAFFSMLSAGSHIMLTKITDTSNATALTDNTWVTDL